MSILFEPVKINYMRLKNRFVRSATSDRCAQITGQISEKQIKIYRELANGGVGLIITGITYIHPSGQISPYQGSIAKDEDIAGLERLTAVVHDRGAKIAVQLFHAGREAAKFLKTKNETAIAPSVVEKDPYFYKTSRKSSHHDGRRIEKLRTH